MAGPTDFSKVSFKPKRHHGYNVLLFIFGSLFPPLAVGARFGIGSDFFLNLILTICGYIPGHVHNFYIQNVRNNKNNRRTPKWAQRYGLVDTTTIKRHEKRSEWAKRYNERNPHSTLEDQQFEDGQAAGSSSRTSLDPGAGASAVRPQQTGGGELWNPDEEQYYNGRSDAASGQSTSRWHYPANFEDTMPAAEPPRKKKIKKDRHARVEDAYSMPADDPSRHRRKKKKRSSTARADDYATTYSRSSTADGPEDPEAAAYAAGARSGRAPANAGGGAAAANANGDDIFQHEF